MSTEVVRTLRVGLTARSSAALHATVLRTGLPEAETMNRALQLYAQVVELAQHEGVYRVDVPDFDDRPLYLLTSRQPLLRTKRKWLSWT